MADEAWLGGSESTEIEQPVIEANDCSSKQVGMSGEGDGSNVEIIGKASVAPEVEKDGELSMESEHIAEEQNGLSNDSRVEEPELAAASPEDSSSQSQDHVPSVTDGISSTDVASDPNYEIEDTANNDGNQAVEKESTNAITDELESHDEQQTESVNSETELPSAEQEAAALSTAVADVEDSIPEVNIEPGESIASPDDDLDAAARDVGESTAASQESEEISEKIDAAMDVDDALQQSEEISIGDAASAADAADESAMEAENSADIGETEKIPTVSASDEVENSEAEKESSNDAAEVENSDAPKPDEATLLANTDAVMQESDTAEADGLVEGADFTVELRPESSELDLSSQDVTPADKPSTNDLSAEVTENAESTVGISGTSTESVSVDEAGVNATESDAGAALSLSTTSVEETGSDDAETAAGNVAENGKPAEDDSVQEDDIKSETVAVSAEDGSVKDSGVADGERKPATAAQKSGVPAKPSKMQECIVCRKVTKCKYNIVRNGDTKHLCDDTCFKMFKARPTAYLQNDRMHGAAVAKCENCQLDIPAAAAGKYIHHVEHEPKNFCKPECLSEFKDTVKTCACCGKDLENELGSFIATVPGSSRLKGFCSHVCQARCSIGDDGTMVIGVGKVPSVTACESCGTPCDAEVLAANVLQLDGTTRHFCSAPCVATFRTQHQRDVPCEWCGARRCNFDMIERLDADGSHVQLFCSLNCLSLYRVNLQANSGQSVNCDQCRSLVPAQYHLTMSDASVRNFCSYTCVAAFQAQFATPASSTAAAAPIPGQKVTANTAGGAGQPATAAVSKSSVYGTRQSTRAASKQTAKQTAKQAAMAAKQAAKSGSGSGMVISNIMSLAPNSQQKPKPTMKSVSTSTSTTPITSAAGAPPQVIIQPPAPKELRNKALLCKPFMQTKATSCRPHSIAKASQTEENWEPKRMLLPCPVPLFAPTPMAMYSSPIPFPIIIPVPIPVPCFIPTSRKTSKSIYKKIKEMQERMPSDPFEAELLMMAEAVASGGRASDSESDVSEDEGDNSPGPASIDTTPSAIHHPAVTHHAAAVATNSTDMAAEDMLQMALRMASEMSEEPMLDLEDHVDAAPVRRVERPPVTDFGTISHDADIIQAVSPAVRGRGGGASGRGKRRSSGAAAAAGGGAGRGRGTPKRQRVDESTMASQSIIPTSAPPPPPVNQPPADANFVLKFTYGVNAYKHWVLQKNAQLEKAAATCTTTRFTGLRGVRPLKLDPLHCTADELNCALCMFVREVRKPNGEMYAPDSILYLCLGIQQYLFENNRIDNIFTDFFYDRFTDCLNEILSTYEVSLNSQGLLVCRIEEEHLWESKQLGAHSPHVLLNTLVYFNTKYFMLRTPAEHLALSFSHIMKHWKKTSSPSGKQGRSVYLRYYSPVQSTNEQGQKRRKEEMPVFEQAENVDNPLRCPVKLYEFYLSKCPESIKNRNDVFYLVPERSCVPDSPVWYSTMSLGIDAMTRMLNRLRPVREIQEAHLQAAQVPQATAYYGN